MEYRKNQVRLIEMFSGLDSEKYLWILKEGEDFHS
jgi:hypothetical protein